MTTGFSHLTFLFFSFGKNKLRTSCSTDQHNNNDQTIPLDQCEMLSPVWSVHTGRETQLGSVVRFLAKWRRDSRAKRQTERQHLWRQTCITARENYPEAWANKPFPGKPPRDFNPSHSVGTLPGWGLPGLASYTLTLSYFCPQNAAFSQILTASCLWCRLLLTGSVSISSLNKYNSDVWSHGGLLNWLQNAFHREAANFPLGYRTL